VDVDGSANPTTIVVTAPPDVDGKPFRYWKHSSGVTFGWDCDSIPLTLLTDGVLTSVDEGPIPDIQG
jgi:hypothetical protein